MQLLKKKEPYQVKQALIGEATDYNVYFPSIKEKILWFVIGMAVSGAVLYIFYEKIAVSVLVGAVCGLAFIPMRTKQVIKKRQQKLTAQFRGLLDALSTSIGAGKNMFDSFAAAADDLTVQFSADADIVKEVQTICMGINNNIPIEKLLLNFAERSGLDDIYNFANVFATCYKKGANIKDVIKNTATILGDKIEIQMELETMVSGQKNEQNIMLVMPVLFILLMKSMGGDLIDLQSPVGLMSVSAAIIIFIASYFVSKKILDIKL